MLVTVSISYYQYHIHEGDDDDDIGAVEYEWVIECVCWFDTMLYIDNYVLYMLLILFLRAEW